MKSRKEILLHPIRMQILQYLSHEGAATPGVLAEVLPEVPRTTLYRHVNLLYQEGYLKVAKEVKIRGTYEREYAINEEKMQGATPREKERQATEDLLLKMMGDFEEYYDKPENDSGKDMIFFTGNTLKLSDEEFSEFLQELFALIAKYDALPEKAGKKDRSITMISSPVSDRPKARKKAVEEAQKEIKAEAKEEPQKDEKIVKFEPRKEPEQIEAEAAEGEMIEAETAELETTEPEKPKVGTAVETAFAAAEAASEYRPEPEPHPEPEIRPEKEAPKEEAPVEKPAASPRLSFREAMEKLNAPLRKLTDRKEGSRIFELTKDSTYDMTDKIKGRDF